MIFQYFIAGMIPDSASPMQPSGTIKPKRPLSDVLRQIRDMADAALRELQSLENPRHLWWRCTVPATHSHLSSCSPAIVIKHYCDIVEARVTKEYWNIRPAKKRNNCALILLV
jgi:hypothetical protein